MRPLLAFVVVGLATVLQAEEPEFPLTADSKPQEGVPKGTLIQGNHTAGEDSVFPGTEREVTLYLPAGFDKTKPVPFMVFQDGVIYQAPVVFDNLIARGDIPPLVGVFVKPGAVPAPNENAQSRYNRSYEYDSITDTYSTFLIDELLPALEEKHGLTFSADPNDTAIAGNSSGGICAFMTAWHRPDRFRRVFSGVGTYVGIRGADRLPVLIRKFEPKPLRVFLQSGTGDNNLYCGDWWMANQMMERSLTWAGYDVNHAWGEGGHNQKHASQIFPDVLRWLWRDWKTNREVKANPKGESQWKGYEVVHGEWEAFSRGGLEKVEFICASIGGRIHAIDWTLHLNGEKTLLEFGPDGVAVASELRSTMTSAVRPYGANAVLCDRWKTVDIEKSIAAIQFVDRKLESVLGAFENRSGEVMPSIDDFVVTHNGLIAGVGDHGDSIYTCWKHVVRRFDLPSVEVVGRPNRLTLSPDQCTVYASDGLNACVTAISLRREGEISAAQLFSELEVWPGYTRKLDEGTERLSISHDRGLCVDTEGRLYVATPIGIQVCDQLGRVTFILPTPKPAYDVCFGGKDLSELFIACGDTIYKRPTKVRGTVSGQMPPVKPPKPKL